MPAERVSLIIFTCEEREHLLQKTYGSFLAVCDYKFNHIILAIDGIVNPAIIAYIKPDLVVYNYKRKGYVNNIKNALINVNTGYFFWLEDDWKFHAKIDMPSLLYLLERNDDWAEILLSKNGPLEPKFQIYPIANNLYQTPFGFSANPCICNSKHIKSAFASLNDSTKGDKLGEDGFEDFLSKTFAKENIKCVIIDPVDHFPISHEGYLETTPRNWHMTNSLEEKTKPHLLTIEEPSTFRKLLMPFKLAGTFLKLAFSQLFNNKVYELCFRIITSAKTIKKDE
jgi:hypothetical protein